MGTLDKRKDMSAMLCSDLYIDDALRRTCVVLITTNFVFLASLVLQGLH